MKVAGHKSWIVDSCGQDAVFCTYNARYFRPKKRDHLRFTTYGPLSSDSTSKRVASPVNTAVEVSHRGGHGGGDIYEISGEITMNAELRKKCPDCDELLSDIQLFTGAVGSGFQ